MFSFYDQFILPFAWRWQQYRRLRFLRRNFKNGKELAANWLSKKPCDLAEGLDGVALRHPVGRAGLAGMILEICFEQVYTGSFYKPKSGDLIIDAGANVGVFSLLIAKQEPSSRIYAFEPFEENYNTLNDNVSAAQVSNIQTFRFALGGVSGNSEMIESQGRSQDHRIAESINQGGNSIQTLTFREVLELTCDKQVALFKCDIEGSEGELFSKAHRSDLEKVDRFAIEYHDNLRPGTSMLLSQILAPTHRIIRQKKDLSNAGYGMMYGVRKMGKKTEK
jgi:FkbM family methyltransferase